MTTIEDVFALDVNSKLDLYVIIKLFLTKTMMLLVL
jgi:hypothetical protein